MKPELSLTVLSPAPPDRSVLGRRSRTKGQSFERVVAEQFRAGMPALREVLTVRRSSQSERAYEADLILEGPDPDIPGWLRDLWVECQHANDPDPESKYAQAIRDSNLAAKRTGRARIPCVIWRKTKSRDLWFTTELSWLNHLLGAGSVGKGLLCTVPLSEFLSALASRSL